jgi:OOP family OmpA-OmpF porin
MKRIALVLLGTLCLSSPVGALAAQPDAAGCKDHPLFPTRMPNYRIEKCETKEFDVYQFFTPEGPRKPRPVEGKFTFIAYAIDDRKAKEASGLEVVRNYENALKKIGGTVAASEPQRRMNGWVMVDGRKVWAEAEKGNGKIWLRIVEEQAMAQTIVADAASLKEGLNATGHVTVEGIYFDTNKTDIKPESAQAIGEVAKMLKADAGLKVFVVGHTDSVGGVDSNLKLSQGRAEAVLQALVRDHGIAAARLKSYGNGPFAPVASNDSEDGRAKNRRVELVKQ